MFILGLTFKLVRIFLSLHQMSVEIVDLEASLLAGENQLSIKHWLCYDKSESG